LRTWITFQEGEALIGDFMNAVKQIPAGSMTSEQVLARVQELKAIALSKDNDYIKSLLSIASA
jgi:hypothetical protein